MRNFRDHSVNRDAVKALVTVFGPREAARQANLPPGTVFSWCRRFKWKKAACVKPTNGINGGPQTAPERDAADILAQAMAKHKEESTLNLAHYTAKAAKAAVKATDPLKVARNVRDVAQVYRVLYPPEEGGELVEGAILVGGAAVVDDHREMLALAEEVQEADVRQEIPDSRPEGD